MPTNVLARANALTTQQDAAWHDGGDQVVGSEFPPPDGNGKEPQSRILTAPVQGSQPTQSRPAIQSAAARLEPKRLPPRSPRTALEPEQVMMPMRQFKRAHNPFV